MGGLCPAEDQTEEEAKAKEQEQAQAQEQAPEQEQPQEQEEAQQPGKKPPAEQQSGDGGDEKKADNAPEPAEEKEEKQAGGGGDGGGIVIRREIRSLSSDEKNRFFNAIDTMFKAKSGRGTSEFFRLASYHGQPAPIYCDHGRETFPGWHRIYLYDFEQAIQAADKENGNDGKVALPYWDYTTNPKDGIPKIIRERFTGWPDDFWPDSMKDLDRTQKLTRAPDGQVTAQLRAYDVTRECNDCLLATQHWAHASTRFGGTYPSIETPHNSVHVISGGAGGQMGSVAWAAYDIIFWLHHCNVDRIYERYLELEPDSHDEFRNFQDTQRVDMFDRGFEPFRKKNGDKYSPKDTFNTAVLGYKYDKLPPPPEQLLRQAPTFVLWAQVKVFEFESKCYQIHVWIVDKDKEDEFKAPQTLDDIDYDSPNYGGGAGIFGRGMECANCVNRPPQDIAIDITRTLGVLGINRYSAKAIAMVLETTEDSHVLQAVSDTPLGDPMITGPLFVNKDGDELLDQDDKKTNNTLEVEALQRYLQKFGYYAPEQKIDGDYGDFTRQAVEDYQRATGTLKVDGIAGPKTRQSIINSKRCDNIDPFAKNDVVDKTVDYANAKYASEKEIKYFIATQPGYLQRDGVEAAIAKACAEYDNNCSLTFSHVEEEKECDIKFSWVMFNQEDDPLRFDGSGGVLGRGGNGFVEFDMAERWAIGLGGDDEKLSDLFEPKTWYRGQPTISLYYTALHELGHTLGLVHTVEADDVMSPWYNPKQMVLSKNDVENIKKIVD